MGYNEGGDRKISLALLWLGVLPEHKAEGQFLTDSWGSDSGRIVPMCESAQ